MGVGRQNGGPLYPVGLGLLNSDSSGFFRLVMIRFTWRSNSDL